MSKKPKYNKILKTETFRENIKEQEFVRFCRVNVAETKDEKVYETPYYQKGFIRVN